MKPLPSNVFELRDNFTSYDAMYIALSETLDVPLLTSDDKHLMAPPDVHTAEIQAYPNGL